MKKKIKKAKTPKRTITNLKKAIGNHSVRSQELVIRVASQELIPTVQDFLEPIHEGKKYSVEKTPFTIRQILSLVAPTPPEQIYKRPGKGGKSFSYVTGNYVEKKLNYVFGFLWDFEVVAHGREGDFIWVQGKLTAKLTSGDTISKTQFGRSEVKYMRDKPHKPEYMVDYGNDMKSAATDSLKKCASLLGVAADIYGKADYQQETGIVVAEKRTEPINDIKLPEDIKQAILCQECDAPISQAGADFSQRLYKKNLCRECSKNQKK